MSSQTTETKPDRPTAPEMTYWIALSMLMMELHTSLRYASIIPDDTPLPTDKEKLTEMMTIVAKSHLEISSHTNPPQFREMLLKYVANHLEIARVELMTLYTVAPPSQKEHLLPIVILVGAVEREFRQ